MALCFLLLPTGLQLAILQLAPNMCPQDPLGQRMHVSAGTMRRLMVLLFDATRS